MEKMVPPLQTGTGPGPLWVLLMDKEVNHQIVILYSMELAV